MDAATVKNRWGGGTSPFDMGWRKLMMWWFIVTDGLLFAGFLAGYGFNRLAADVAWPDRAKVFSMPLVTAMTFILITSSATMATAVAAARRDDRATLVRHLGFTLLGGLVFLSMQAVEWAQMIRDGASLESNPWGPAAFGSYFYMVTGFHGTHVLLGLVVLLLVWKRAKAGRFSAEGVELAGLYWHFVDLVWVFIFGCFYLI